MFFTLTEGIESFLKEIVLWLKDPLKVNKEFNNNYIIILYY